MKHQRQLGFEILDRKSAKYFGGAFLKNSNPKVKRPISTKRSMHLVMRSTRATGFQSFLKKDKRIRELIAVQASFFGVKIYMQANGGNHLHLIILPRSRDAFNGFVRAITGLIARVVLGVERGSPKCIKFWDKRPFTRIIEWGREFRYVCGYLLQNTLEALGFIPYCPRTSRYKLLESTA